MRYRKLTIPNNCTETISNCSKNQKAKGISYQDKLLNYSSHVDFGTRTFWCHTTSQYLSHQNETLHTTDRNFFAEEVVAADNSLKCRSPSVTWHGCSEFFDLWPRCYKSWPTESSGNLYCCLGESGPSSRALTAVGAPCWTSSPCREEVRPGLRAEQGTRKGWWGD